MINPEAEGDRCERHPVHLKSIGVCPCCLREALSRLLWASSYGIYAAAASTTSSSPYSYLSSVSVSPSYIDLKRPRPSFHFERSVEDRDSAGWKEPLTKSQSLVFARGRKNGKKEKEKEGKKEKKGRFWSKLLWGSSKRKEEGVASLDSKAFKGKPSTK
ncbi:uncharacterized protein LOC120104967 [Phoenix dactylifera]|uniref:Uncharacterized protein LOC120104967 n=1 Tax=Phoenix dactylifera TaxID=42345 RepID=A0A8B8ZMU3_PHODC|nr:uncharacterized protein LOC120104967 [Phoenix dactylifera]